MRVLVVKTSSLGDVIHTLPALTDAASALPGIRFDWVVEEAFAEVPAWHPAVERVIPIAVRRWRKAKRTALSSGEFGRYLRDLRSRRYDAVIDAQGLLKSALLATFPARGPSHGLDRSSAREPAAALFYRSRVHVERRLHAVERTRRLFAAALGYAVPPSRGHYGIAGRFAPLSEGRYLVFLHGTTRPDKHWPETYWRELARLAVSQGWRIRVPHGNAEEEGRATMLAQVSARVEVLPRLGLGALAAVIASAAAVVSVDTGLAHLTAALGRPNVILYGPTDPGLVGGYGERQVSLRAGDFPPVDGTVEPQVFAPLTPQIVWTHLQAALSEG